MEAYLYETLENNKVKCNLCSHRCVIKDGRRGICSVRENEGGILKTLVYGRLIARHIDPIEKKPLFHFLPGTLSYSVATVGCNFRCRFCQNADIAQMPAERKGMIMGDTCTPSEVVDAAERGGCKSIAYTYTEPTVFFEFAYETARLASARGIRNVFVTNGYMTAEALEMISPYLDAANVDLKAFTDNYYKELCSARLKHVQATLTLMKSHGIFVEVTTLIVPDLNDDPTELKELATFIVQDLGVETPWHISRFHPTYKLSDRPPTPVKTLTAARKIGLKAGLRYVYTGNVPGNAAENSLCYKCGETVIERWGFQVGKMRIKNGNCTKCGVPIDGVWE
ncbi:MAG: AmmeMemoRadiSam system radical SAM enzyme [Deltaproteobacteria bacterium]|nr:AmmeMemoRadiSam system radical SAM enzyme [Deltaproteobacteria bacterium]